MGLGQSMITVLFFALLTIMFLNAISLLNKADQELLIVATSKTATDLGQSLMSEILTKRFDENSDSTTVQKSVTAFTAAGSLGTDATESFTLPDRYPFKSISKYDDVDDYNHYSRLIDSTHAQGIFHDSAIVYYVQMTNPPTSYSDKWWTKRVEVWVTNEPYMVDTNKTTGVPYHKWLKFYSIVTNTKK